MKLSKDQKRRLRRGVPTAIALLAAIGVYDVWTRDRPLLHVAVGLVVIAVLAAGLALFVLFHEP